MRAMVLRQVGQPLELLELPDPGCGAEEVLIRVEACGVCRTNLHLLDGELHNAKLPLVLGHQIVGEVIARGERVRNLEIGERVGVPWLGFTDGTCAQCRAGRENLCEHAGFTGYTRDGGYAELAAADSRFAFPLPVDASATQLAPLLCAGLIGHRAYRLAGLAPKLGLYGFGAAAHILAQVARFEGRQVYAFTKPGDVKTQAFARALGCVWAGGSDQPPPEPLDAAVLFASVGALVPAALRTVGPGGTVVCAGIHMSDIPSFPYSILWEERVLRSVANLTREDARAFLSLAPRVPVKTQVTVFALEQANEALQALREGTFEGAAVLRVR